MAEPVEKSMQYIGVHPFPIATWPLIGNEVPPKDVEILDVRGSKTDDHDLAYEIKTSLQEQPNDGSRSLPPTLFSSEHGLETLDEMSSAGTCLLARHAHDIVLGLLPGTVLLDIGNGSLQRIKVLLEAVDSHHKIMDYYALDTDREKLESTLKTLLSTKYNYVRCHGLLGSYNDGRKWIGKYENKQRPVCVLSLDSTFSTISRDSAPDFWRQWSDCLSINNKFNSTNARVILGIDHRTSNDDGNHDTGQDTASSDRRLVESIVGRANLRLGYTGFEPSTWSAKGVWDAARKTYTQYLVPKEDTTLEGEQVKAGEKFVAHSYRYDESDIEQLLLESNLKEVRRYMKRGKDYGLHIFAPR